MSGRVVDAKDFPRVLARDMRALERKIKRAVDRAAKKSAKGIEKRTPKAFGELREAIHVVDGPSIRVDAPHAQAVEIGSRPHLVPIEALVKWVKLRGMQGLNLRKYSNSAKYGTTTHEMAHMIAGELKRRERHGSLDIDAPEHVARAIQQKILKVGTRPHFFVKGSLDPVVMKDLDREIRRALGK